MKKKKEERFVTVHEENGMMSINRILVDRETGVHYFYSYYGSGGAGMTVLLDETGKPLISKNYDFL